MKRNKEELFGVDDINSVIDDVQNEMDELYNKVQDEITPRIDFNKLKPAKSNDDMIKIIKKFVADSRGVFIAKIFEDIGWFKSLELDNKVLCSLYFNQISLETKSIVLRSIFLESEKVVVMIALRSQTMSALAISKMEFASIVRQEFGIGFNRALGIIDTMIANGHFQYVKTEEKTKFKLVKPTNISEVENHIFQMRINKARINIAGVEEIIMERD